MLGIAKVAGSNIFMFLLFNALDLRRHNHPSSELNGQRKRISAGQTVGAFPSSIYDETDSTIYAPAYINCQLHKKLKLGIEVSIYLGECTWTIPCLQSKDLAI